MHMKRIAAPKHYNIPRKKKRFTAFPKGPHKKERGLTLLVIIRDLLKLAETRKEVKKILSEKEVFVDGKARKDNYCVGLMDVINIPLLGKSYRVLADKKGLSLKEIPKSERNVKIARIEGVRMIKGGKFQLNLYDGKNIVTDKKYKPLESLIVTLPELEVKKDIPLEKGSLALICGGKHVGKIARILKIEGKRAYLKNTEKKEEFNTIKDYVYVIGKEKPELKV